MDRVDLLDGLIAVAIDEVKSKKGQRYLTVVSDPFTGRVVWVTEGRSKTTVEAFFDALGPQRAARLEIVTTDGAEWIRTVVATRAPNAEICLDTFHAMQWATKALDEVRREAWRRLKGKTAAKASRGCGGLCCGTGPTSPSPSGTPSGSWKPPTGACSGDGS